MVDEPTDAGPPPEDASGAGAGEDAARRGGPGGPRHAWRLTFAYDGDQVRVTGRRRVRMLAPPDESALVEGSEGGYWVELRGGDAPVYRQVLAAPIRTEFEVFSPDGSMTHVPVPEVRGDFEVVVPDLPEADAVVLHGPALPGGEAPGAEEGGDEKPGEGADDDVTPAPAERRLRAAGAADRLRARPLLSAPLREADDGDG